MATRAQVDRLRTEIGDLQESRSKTRTHSSLRKEFEGRPIPFMAEILGVRLTPDQVAAVHDLETRPQVHIRGAHATGKDYLASAYALYKAVVLGGTVISSAKVERQVRHVYFHTVAALWRAADLGGDLFASGLFVPGGGRILGFTASDPSGFTGWHSSAGVTVILSEGQGLEGWVFEAAQGCLAGPRDTLLVVGNPLFALENLQRLGVGARIRYGRPGCNHVEGVADHVGENQGDRFGGVGVPGQVAALDLGEMLAHRVDRGDLRAAGE